MEEKCIRLKCAFPASDCGSGYKKAIVSFNSDVSIKGTGAIPDIVHICKNICCSLKNWFLIFENTRVNLGMLRVIRESASVLGRTLRNLLPLDCLRKRDRMN